MALKNHLYKKLTPKIREYQIFNPKFPTDAALNHYLSSVKKQWQPLTWLDSCTGNPEPVPLAACRPKYLWGHKQLSWPRTPGPLLACCGLKCVAISLTSKQAAARTVLKNKAATWRKRWYLRAESDKEDDGILIFTAVDVDFLVCLLGMSLAWVQSCAPRCDCEAFVIPR